MSLKRTAVRLATYQGMLADTVFQALCGDCIWDSRIGNFSAKEPHPVVIITTEDAQGRAFNPQNGGPPFDDHAGLTFEMALRTVEYDEVGDFLGYGTPVTDREAEAVLDAIEERILWLLGSNTHPLIRQTIRRVSGYQSQRFHAEDIGEKLAMRLVTVTVELIGDEVGSAWDPPTGPFASLPDPLRTVCAGLPEGSSGHQTCLLLAEKFPPPPAPPGQAARVSLTVAPQPLSATAPPIPPEAAPPAASITFPLDQD